MSTRNPLHCPQCGALAVPVFVWREYEGTEREMAGEVLSRYASDGTPLVVTHELVSEYACGGHRVRAKPVLAVVGAMNGNGNGKAA